MARFFFLSKFNLSLVFTNGLRFSTSRFVLFKLDIRFSTSTFVLFRLDIRFSTLTFVLLRRYGRELVLTLSTVFQVQHSCYLILGIRFSDQHSFFQPQHSFLKFNIFFYSDVSRDVTPRSRGVVYICGWQRHDVAWCFLLNSLPKRRVRGKNAGELLRNKLYKSVPKCIGNKFF